MPDTFWARTDNGNAKNPELNLLKDPAVEITFVPTGTDGDIILESGDPADPDTQVVIDGTAYDFTFEFSATSPTANNQGAGQYPVELQGEELIVITVYDYPTTGETTRLVFFTSGDVTQEQMDSIGNGASRPSGLDETGPGIICFASGTMLRTPAGERAIETLRVGDLVTTVDDGPMPIIWITRTDLDWPAADEAALPILISRGALGGLPARDLVVSPQHKVLLQRDPGDRGVLAPAQGLTRLPGIRVMRGKRSIRYHHILLARHAVLVSEGLPSESFFPGPMALHMLAGRNVLSLQAVIGALGRPYGPTARPCLTMAETRALAHDLRMSHAAAAE
ncbi:MAG: Hint domain-containing protein [Pseudomonadota bacterium]